MPDLLADLVNGQLEVDCAGNLVVCDATADTCLFCHPFIVGATKMDLQIISPCKSVNLNIDGLTGTELGCTDVQCGNIDGDYDVDAIGCISWDETFPNSALNPTAGACTDTWAMRIRFGIGFCIVGGNVVVYLDFWVSAGVIGSLFGNRVLAYKKLCETPFVDGGCFTCDVNAMLTNGNDISFTCATAIDNPCVLAETKFCADDDDGVACDWTTATFKLTA